MHERVKGYFISTLNQLCAAAKLAKDSFLNALLNPVDSFFIFVGDSRCGL